MSSFRQSCDSLSYEIVNDYGNDTSITEWILCDTYNLGRWAKRDKADSQHPSGSKLASKKLYYEYRDYYKEFSITERFKSWPLFSNNS